MRPPSASTTCRLGWRVNSAIRLTLGKSRAYQTTTRPRIRTTQMLAAAVQARSRLHPPLRSRFGAPEAAWRSGRALRVAAVRFATLRCGVRLPPEGALRPGRLVRLRLGGRGEAAMKTV